jgi:threonine/homoserine/homoserine lactone efflux protein
MPLIFPVLSGLVAMLAAIPLGPVNMEIIRRVLNRHPVSALVFAAGAALGDGMWPVAAFLGLAPLLKIRWLAVIFWSLAVLVLLYLGTTFIREARENKPKPAVAPLHYKKRFSIMTGFLLVVSNPGSLLTWMAVIGIFHNEGFLPEYGIVPGMVLWISVAFGTFAYFCFVILLVHRFHKVLISERRLRFIRIFFGCLILVMACYFAFNLVRSIFVF